MGQDQPLRICVRCNHYRLKPNHSPFTRIELSTPGTLEAKLEWDRDQQRIADLERQCFDANGDFDFEPVSYAWCERLTEHAGRFSVDPVSGVQRRLYVLCARANYDGRCPQYEE